MQAWHRTVAVDAVTLEHIAAWGKTETARIPVVGRIVSAGFPSPADDFSEEAVDLPRWMIFNPAATYLWRVRGSSMIALGIHDGDLACVDKSTEPTHGCVVLAMIDGEPTLKSYQRQGNHHVLAYANPDMPTFVLDEVGEAAIWGVVLWTLRLHRPLARA